MCTFADCLNRWVLETSGTLEPRRSALEDDFEEEEEDKEEEQPMEIDEPNGREKVRTFIISLCSDLIKFIKIICCFFLFFSRIIIVDGALQGNGTETGTGNMKDITGMLLFVGCTHILVCFQIILTVSLTAN